MVLGEGTTYAHGIIVGKWGSQAAMTQWPRVVYEVREVLERLYGKRYGIDNNNYVESVPLSNKVRSGVLTSTGDGVIVRIINGAGRLYFDRQVVDVDYGDWILIPPGVKYEFEGAVLSGMNLRYVTVGVIDVSKYTKP